MAYLLDADVFIRAKNLHYGFDICPAFWDWIIERNSVGVVFSIEKVGDELKDGDDELAEWAKARERGLFLRPNEASLPAFGAVTAWTTTRTYTSAAVSTFLQLADYYLVVQALAGGHTVVTHEVPSASKRKVKIPDACIGLGVKCVTPYEMLRHEGARFVLGPNT